MASLRVNVVANLAGSAWIAALTIAITPLQIHLLGIEAYGLIALISILQVALAALDLGLCATVTREIAADVSPAHGESVQIVDTASSLYWLMAALIAAVLYFAAPRFADTWFRGNALGQDEITQALRWIAAYVALRWPVALYAGVLSGLQRMDLLNWVKGAAVTLRLGGGLLLLLLVPSLLAFLAWFTAGAALELLACALLSHKLLPGLSLHPKFSAAAVTRVWRFSAAMNLIAIISVLLTQADRLVVSNLLGLEALGYYSLAYNTAVGVSLIHIAVNNASLPAFAAAHGLRDHAQLLLQQGKASQVIAYTVMLPCFALLFYGHDILRLWVGLREADAAYAPLVLLVAGFLLIALVSTSHIVAVACGRPGLTLKVNLVAVVFYFPALYLGTRDYGMVGAAASWLLLNVYYVFTLVPLVQRLLLRESFAGWLERNVVRFVLLGLASFSATRLALSVYASDALAPALLALVLACGVYMVAGYFLLSRPLRRDLLELIGRPWMFRA